MPYANQLLNSQIGRQQGPAPNVIGNMGNPPSQYAPTVPAAEAQFPETNVPAGGFSYLNKFMGRARTLQPVAQASEQEDEYPSVQEVIGMPKYTALSPEEKIKVLETVNPEHVGNPTYDALPLNEKIRVYELESAGPVPDVPTELMPAHEPTKPQESLAKKTARAVIPVVRPIAEGLGMVGGGVLGSPGGVPGMVIGGGVGYAGVKGAFDIAEEKAGIRKQPETLSEATIKTAKDFQKGLEYEMYGRIGGEFLMHTAKFIGKYIAKPLLGRISGTGKGAIDEALEAAQKSDPTINPFKTKNDFDKALRGKIKPEEIVENAKNAIESLKAARAAKYQARLQKISETSESIDLTPIRRKTADLMQRYNIKVGPEGLDISRIAMGKKGRSDIEDIIEIVSEWGSKQGDDTALGLDVLKRQLDDFWSESSQARQFVTELRKTVKNTIVKNVPEYEKMVGGYSEATTLIKDIEAGLMLRKKGISGRIVADQTLRRIMSAMRENFALRKELLDALGAKAGQELSAQTAGYTMSKVLPIGLAGTGPVLAVEAAFAHFINPVFWPVLAASSPRVQGEFLRLFGQSMKAVKAVPKRAIAPTIAAVDERKEQK